MQRSTKCSAARSRLAAMMCCAAVVLGAGDVARGQAPAEAPAGDAEAEAAYRAFRQQAEVYDIRAGDGKALALYDQALLNCGNPVRLQERGALFLWLRAGRPQAIGSVFTCALPDKVHQKHGFHSLAETALAATVDGTPVWAPAAGAIQWRALPGAPAPAGSPRLRLTQMRGLVRRFGVTLISAEGERTGLRPMPQPLFRYAAEEAGVADGAIFSFVVATDPEALLLIEAAGEPDGLAYRYAWARFHYWQLSAELDGATVWAVEADETQAVNQRGDAAHFAKPYISFHPPEVAEMVQ
jgi:hypothetical protein